MPSFEIIGTGKDTGRKRKRIYPATNAEIAKLLAEEEGTIVEEITELTPEPPTDKQLEYANDLGISIPDNATKEDLIDLIDFKLSDDKKLFGQDREFADKYRIPITKFTGKKALFNRIHASLAKPGHEEALIAWFVFCVYSDLAQGVDNNSITGPDSKLILEITEEIKSEEKILPSIRRYRGKDLIWFGERTLPDGTVDTGGSKRTIAYNRISSLLEENLSFPKKTPQPKSRHQPASHRKNEEVNTKGCIQTLLIIFVVAYCIRVFYGWFN